MFRLGHFSLVFADAFLFPGQGVGARSFAWHQDWLGRYNPVLSSGRGIVSFCYLPANTTISSRETVHGKITLIPVR